MGDLVLKFIKFSEYARTPTYAKPGDSGADLHVANSDPDPLWPGETRVFWTDIGVELPAGHEAQVRPRSGLSSRGILVHVGTIDEGFRGNIGVTLTNTTREPVQIKRGDRVAQLVVSPVVRARFELVEALGESERGASGFGSSGT